MKNFCTVAFCVFLLSFGVNALNPVPGVDIGFGWGFDILKQNYTQVIYDFTYDYGQQWTMRQSGETYDYPDQTYITELPENDVVLSTQVFSSWDQYAKFEAAKLGLDGSLGVQGNGSLYEGAFNQSKQEVDNMFANNTHAFTMEDRYCPIYRLDMYPMCDLTAAVLAIIDALPDTADNEDDEQMYLAAIGVLGTHVLNSAELGGYLNFTTVYNTSLYDSHSQRWVQQQADLSITRNEISHGISADRNSTTPDNDSDFVDNSTESDDVVGGDAAVFESEGYVAWISTTYTQPGLLPGEMVMKPLSFVIDDYTKSQTMDRMIAVYIQNGEC